MRVPRLVRPNRPFSGQRGCHRLLYRKGIQLPFEIQKLQSYYSNEVHALALVQ